MKVKDAPRTEEGISASNKISLCGLIIRAGSKLNPISFSAPEVSCHVMLALKPLSIPKRHHFPAQRRNGKDKDHHHDEEEEDGKTNHNEEEDGHGDTC